MGFFTRWREANAIIRKKQMDPEFANTIVPTSVGPKGSTTTYGTTTTPANTTAFVPGPNPEPYLQTGEWRDPFRVRTPYLHEQPEIPVQEPWAVSSVYIQNVNTSTGQFKGQVPPTPQAGRFRSVAPPMTTQRDLLYDAANFHTLQKFTFVTPSQRYFDQRIPLPEYTTPSMPAHSVITGNNQYYPSEMQPGWSQSFVPEPGMHFPIFGDSPPLLLSTPLNVRVRQYSTYDTTETRRPLKTKAPKRHRSGSS